DRVVGDDTGIRQMTGELAGSLQQLRIGHRRMSVAIGDFAAPRGGMPAQQLRNGSDQIGMQHDPSPLPKRQTMLKPPLMLSTWPLIKPLRGEASRVTIGATSLAWPRRRSG